MSESDLPMRDRLKRFVFRVICITIREHLSRFRSSRRVKSREKYLEIIPYLEWRLGLNLFKGGCYEEALILLENVCIGSSIANNTDDYYLHPDSNVHLTAARCCLALHYETNVHICLQKAYVHYKNTIDRLEAFPSSIILPDILYEFSCMLEVYGSVQVSADLYRRILNDFPTYRGYFNCMYRSSILGKHLADINEDAYEQSEMLTKSTEALFFLLEALPITINEAHILFLYARCLEDSTDVTIHFRCKGIYKTLFDHCRDADIVIAEVYTYMYMYIYMYIQIYIYIYDIYLHICMYIYRNI
jgi:tetratricopeptide (TPR) repeat protein